MLIGTRSPAVLLTAIDMAIGKQMAIARIARNVPVGQQSQMTAMNIPSVPFVVLTAWHMFLNTAEKSL